MFSDADADDAKWFAAHPNRNHRIRRPFQHEFISHAPPIEWSLVSQVGGEYFRIPLQGGVGGRAEFPDDEQLLSNMWTTHWLKRQNSPYFKDIWKLNTAMCVAPRAS
jgi:hypothetical protein